ncbi:hypothetical protein BZY71_21575 [Leclercia adecarboxylata]|nr:hypothetical protein BZY71_21575 [Leclercia adecarboxylata]
MPVTVGMLPLLLLPAAILPVTGPTLSSTLVMTGISGTRLSTVTVMVPESSETLPASSVAVRVKLCDPSASGVSERHVQLPLISTTTSPTSTLPVVVWS